MSNYKKLNAIWSIDYDMHKDKCYDRPSCPECRVPIGKIAGDGKYRCYSCHKICNVDQKMLDWFADREGEKIEMRDCFNCGGIGTSEDHLVKNYITLEWQTAWGICKKCGARFIV